MPLTRAIDMDELQQYFTMPEKAVAKHLGICLTSLKKICRQNGIHRWPYRKVKSMDKKLRKLEHSGASSEGSSFTEDGLLDGLDDGVLCAIGSELNSPGSADFESSSEAGEATASSATTPRGVDCNPSTVSSPLEFGSEDLKLDEPPTFTVSPSKSSAFETVPVKMSKATAGQPIKMEISLPPDVLKQMANGGQNITFRIQGVDGSGTQVHLSSDHFQQAAQPVQPRATPKITTPPTPKSQPAPAKEENMGMSDDDIIAMLAGCAAPCKPRHESFADIVRDKGSAASSSDAAGAQNMDNSCLEPSDAELMAALAGCCGVQNPFNPVYDEDHHHGEDMYHADHDVMTWGGADTMEDILGEDCH